MSSYKKVFLRSSAAVASAFFVAILGCGNNTMAAVHVQTPSQPVPPPAVPAPTLISLHIANPVEIVRSETPYAFKVIADYSDGSSGDVSSAVSWAGSSAITYISASGIAFCNAPGTSQVSAQLGPLVASSPFDCVMKRIVPAPGFAEHAQQFDGPFPSWLNVQTVFGAKGDGKTDDTQSFQNALNQLVLTPSVLWVPKGTYVISRTLGMRVCQQFSIVGEDPRSTTIEWDGPSGGTMIDIEGCDWFRLARLGWNGQKRAGVAMHIGSSLENGDLYPTYDDIEDQQISQTAVGIQIGFAGETTVQRVHFDHNTVAGISLENWDALNFNVIDSLFTDCNVGVTNAAPGGNGSGAFNVSNSVFVRSQLADMMMGNTGPFSERQNISFDSKAFFVGGAIGAGANIILQANTIIDPTTTPVQIGSPGPIMLIDNSFMGLDPSLNILSEVGYDPLGVFSIGNQFSVDNPFTGNIGLINSFDEAKTSTESNAQVDIPTDVFVPPSSGRPIVEVPLNSSSDVIQELVNKAASSTNGGVVHFPSGEFRIDQTIDIPDSSNLTVTGDGPLTVLASAKSLIGPVVRVSGTHAKLENMQIRAASGFATDTGLEIDIEDRPSTVVHCDQCKTVAPDIGLLITGIDNALVDIRIGELNAAPDQEAAVVRGGPARRSGYQTLGRLDAFMSGLDLYKVSDGGHFLVEDGWHDSGQGSQQFDLSGSGIVTHEGGTVYTPTSGTGMAASGFSGTISVLGVSTNSTFALNQSPKAAAFVAGTVQITGVPILLRDSSVVDVTQLSNFDSVNGGTPAPVSDLPSSPSRVESMFSQARTEYVTPRLALPLGATEIDLHRVVVTSDNVGISIQPKVSTQQSAVYSIRSLATGQHSELPSSCASGHLSMEGAWTLQTGLDGFYGLNNGSAFLSDRPGDFLNLAGVGFSRTMSDAGQRWNIRPTGDGSFHIVNRANGEALTSDSSGCISLSAESDASGQRWSVDLADNR